MLGDAYRGPKSGLTVASPGDPRFELAEFFRTWSSWEGREQGRGPGCEVERHVKNMRKRSVRPDQRAESLPKVLGFCMS